MATRWMYLDIFVFVVTTFLFTGSGAQCHYFNRPEVLRAYSFTRSFTLPSTIYGTFSSDFSCAWRIEASVGHVVMLMTRHVNLRRSPDCRFNNISVFDGYINNRPPMKTFCSVLSGALYSSGTFMYVTFTYKGQVEFYRGFTLSFSEVPSSMTTPWPEMNSRQSSLKSTSLVAGLAGAFTLLFIVVGVCRYIQNRSRRESTRSPNSASSQDERPGNSSVFTVSDRGNVLPDNGGHTNLSFSEYSEPPPSYESLQHSGSPAESSCLPSYSEVLMMSNDPDSPKPEEHLASAYGFVQAQEISQITAGGFGYNAYGDV